MRVENEKLLANAAKERDVRGQLEEENHILRKENAQLGEGSTNASTYPGTVVYVDCAPADGSGVELDAYLAPLMERVAKAGYTDERTGKNSGPVAYYDLIPYNNGQKSVVGLLLSELNKLPPVLLVDSRSPMASRVLEVLRPVTQVVSARR